MLSICLVLSLLYAGHWCFWPPPYNIDLEEVKTFETFENFQSKNDEIEQNEDEMIAQDDYEKMRFKKHKHPRIFRMNNIKKDQENIFLQKKEQPQELYWRSDESKLSNMEISKKYNMDEYWRKYFLKKIKRDKVDIKSEIKREEIKDNTKQIHRNKTTVEDLDYNYGSLKKQFDDNLSEEETQMKNSSIHETSMEQSESQNVSESRDKLNCSSYESGIGVTALKCLLGKHTAKNQHIIAKISKICLVWIIAYIIVAIPLWCTRGWCCCCFRCKFCKPREQIEWVKAFSIYNKTGIMHSDQENVEYQPTKYENYYQTQLKEELEKVILQ